MLAGGMFLLAKTMPLASLLDFLDELDLMY